MDIESPRLSDIVTPTKANAGLTTANAARRTSTPDKLSRLLRGDLDTIVAKALKKNSQERYASVTAMAEDLRRYLGHEPITARPDTFAYRAAKFMRRNRPAVALATLAFVALVGGVVGTLFQARAARIQRDFAMGQMSRTEVINEFHEFLLSDAAPSGKPFTVNELLDRAEHIVERQHAANDTNRVELLISIGFQYSTHDEAARARRVLEEAYKLSRGMSERSPRAVASCALAASLAYDGELPRAETLFQEGLGGLPEELQFTFDRVFCLLRGSEVAQERGDSQEGVARVQAAQRVLRHSLFDSDMLEMQTSMDLAEAYRKAGQNREATSAFGQAAALLSSLGRDDTETAATLFNNWALALTQLGHPLDAERMYRRAIEISRADQAEKTVSPIVLNNYAKTLRDLGRLGEAADYAERAYAKAQQVGHQSAINQSLLERARIYREQRNLTRAAAMLAEVEPRLQRALPPGHYAFASLASEQALIALGRGNLQSALQLADQAVAIDEATIKAGGEGTYYLPTLLVCRSGIELQAGRRDEAAADATRALSQLQAGAQPGTFSCTLGRAYLTLGRALQSQGKRDEARAAFRSALENLENTLGPEHPDTRAARQLGDLESQPY